MSTLDGILIAPPEPDVTPAEMIKRARGLREALQAAQDLTEKRGTYSEEMHQAFSRAGFYRILQPKRFGGYELDVPTFFSVVIEIARGCPGSGWCLCLAAGHHLQLAGLYSERAQAAAYGPNGAFAAPCRPIPMGTAERVEGGWRITGEWDYCSGAPYSTHALLAVRFQGADTALPVGLALVPRDGWTLLDNWADTVLGMAGSGSNTIRVDGTVVPDDFVVEGTLQQVPKGARSPGYRVHGNPMYCGIFSGYSQLEIAAILVGCARAAADEYERILRAKKTMGPRPRPRYMAPEYQRWLGSALGKIDAAEDALLRSAERYMEYCWEAVSSGDGVSAVPVARLELVAYEVAELTWQATELLFRTSGSSEGARNGSRMQRYYRDLSMARTNMSPKVHIAAESFASAYFELGETQLF